jgi:outer membrane protein assembly factor BamB
LDGEVYAEPLILNSSVIMATEDSTIYALNASSGKIVWMTHLGTPMRGSQLPCGNIDPSGITGTPVADQAAGRVYVLAFVQPGVHMLYTIDLKTGQVLDDRVADPPGSNPLVEQERGALALSNGVVYIPYGGLAGDCGSYHGWVVGLYVNGSNGLISFQVPSEREGGIWSPSGVVVAQDGSVLVSTGNSASSSVFDFGNSVIRLSSTLQIIDWFAPSNWVELNNGDTGLGSTSPTIVERGLVFQVGKEGVGYLLNFSSLGHVGGNYSAGRFAVPPTEGPP